MSRTLPGTGAPVRSKTCLYTLTPDRDFVLGPIPGHEAVLVGLGAAHGFKFAPTIGRLLADLAVDGRTDADVAPFRPDRAALTEPSQPVSWLV
jgi:sarcosine oxidase